MLDFFEYMITNKYFGVGLLILLIVLIVLFFVLLFMGKEKSTKGDIDKVKTDDNKKELPKADNVDFDHNEYVKETTAEFELAPVEEVEPAPDNYIPEYKDESPAIKFEHKDEVEPVMKDFSFDELSQSISDELDKLKEEGKTEEVKEDASEELPKVEFVDSFKEVESEIKPVEITKTDDIKAENPTFMINDEESNDDIVLPKLAKAEEKNEPVIKEENVPLFASFDQETYDINQKD